MLKILPITFFVIGLILLLVGYFGPEKLSEIQRKNVFKRLPFLKDAESTKKWSTSTDKGYLKIYMFNVTNLDEYLNEEEDFIRVKEIGPIVYSYRPNITNLNWSEDENLLTFHKFKSYYFEEEMSEIPLNTTIISADIIAAGIIDKVNGMNYFKRLIADPTVNNQFRKFNTSMFFSKTLDELLFAGYDISVLKAVNEEAAQKYSDGLYGFMHGKNHSHDGQWTMYTGKDDINKLGTMEKWENVRLNTCWGDQADTCGHVKGTDGSRFHPALDPTKNDLRVDLYSSSLFRSLSMIFKRYYVFKGIRLARYELEESNFILSLEHNKCYCPDPEKNINGTSLCYFNGLLDISRCKKAPIIISAPHFLYGSPELLDHVKGLSPDLDKHESYVDADPVTGIVLKGRKRLQINAYVRKHKTGHKSRDTIVPVMWIEEGQEITDEKAVLYYAAIHGLVDKVGYILMTCILVGTVLIVAALISTSINIIKNGNEKFAVNKSLNKKSDINHNTKYHKAATGDTTLPMEERVKITSAEK